MSLYKDFQNDLEKQFYGLMNFIALSDHLPNLLKRYLLTLCPSHSPIFSFDKNLINLVFSPDLKPYMLKFIEEIKKKGAIIQKGANSEFYLIHDEEQILKNDITHNVDKNELDSLLFKKSE